MFSRSSSFYELLDVEPDADRSIVMAAWMDKRRAAVAMTAMLGPLEVEAVCAQLDEAFRTLCHPLQSKRYQRYHRFSRLPAQPSPPRPPERESESASASASASEPASDSASDSGLPSILAVSTAVGVRATARPQVARGSWVQMSLPLLAADHFEHRSEARIRRVAATAEASARASDQLRLSPEAAAALQKREPLVTVELLDSLDLLEEALSSDPGMPKLTFRIV